MQNMLKLNITVGLECQFFRAGVDGTLKWGQLRLQVNICEVHSIEIDPTHRRVFHSFCREACLQQNNRLARPSDSSDLLHF